MKIFKINTIMLLLLLTFVISIGTIPVFAESELRVSLVFVSPEKTNTEIDNAYNTGFNVVILQHPRDYLKGVRAGTIKDSYPASIAYAHNKGLKVVWLIDFKQIPDGENVNLFLSNPVFEEKLVSDLTWILQNYDIDGLELEEPVIGGSGQAGRDYLNKLFTRLRKLIDTKTVNKPDFRYGFNSPALWDVNIALGGLDQKYISDNRLFDYVAFQTSISSLNEYKIVYNEWSTKFVNLEKIPAVYIWWATLMNSDACSWANGRNQPTTLYNVPACYNQELFEQVKWLNKNNVNFFVWPAISMGINERYFPNDQTPGSNVREKIQWILTNNMPLPNSPSITTQPSSWTITTGQTVTFNVIATGQAPLTYQWQKNGVNIPGATGATYTTPLTSSGDNGAIFRVVVSNSAGSVTSNTATLSVTSSSTPTTSINMINNSGFESGTAPWGFHISIDGTGSFISSTPGYGGSSNSASLIITSPGSNMQLYQDGVTLQVNTRYRLSFAAYSTTGHDVTVRLFKHDSPYTDYGLTFTADLGTSWQTFSTEFNTTGFSGTVNDGRLMFWLAPFAAKGDTYYIDNVQLERIGLPTITNHPSDQTIDIGQTATFNVTAADTTSLTYQWQKNGMDIPGATGASYTTPSTIMSDNGSTFRVRLTNSVGSVTSNNAILTVSSKNLIKNSGFESAQTSWGFHTNGVGTFTTVSPGYEGNNAANVVLGDYGTNIQLYQTGITLEPDTRYRLSFAAYSTTGHDVTVRLLKHVSPYTAYIPDYTADLGTNWQTFSTEFKTTGFSSTVNDGRLMFWLAPFAAKGDTYCIDNIRLEIIV